MPKQLPFSDNWFFYLNKDCSLHFPDADAIWTGISIPHDWQIWDASNLYEDGTGWYKKTYHCEKDKHTGDRFALYFEGVYQNCTVFVNRQPVGEWKYGYSSFTFDITDALKDGANEILVRCHVLHPNSRWYSGAGIYRNVWLLTFPKLHLNWQSLYLVARETDAASKVWSVDASAEMSGAVIPEGYHFLFSIHDQDGALMQEIRSTSPAVTFTMNDPALWDIQTPYCYHCTLHLVSPEGEIVDELHSTFGCKTVTMLSDEGLYVNHRKVVLHGVCMHHDLGALGAAFSKEAARRQLKILKSMGVNAIRTSHNMPAPELMDLADEMGFLICSEAFDCWKNGKTDYDYHLWFENWYEKDVASWVTRDRNHPSLLFWSIGNEITDTHNRADGTETTKKLMEAVLTHDPKQNGIVTFGSNFLAWEGSQKAADVLKVVGYNYGEFLYDEQHAAHQDWIIYGSETASIIQSRGIYHFPAAKPVLSDDDLQCSSLGNSQTSWGAKSTAAIHHGDLDHPYSLGQFLWSGFDYIGEPTPYHTRSSYFGQIDTAGFEKDAFYQYLAGWVSYKEQPVLHIFPYWDFNEKQLIDIGIVSNAPSVELFFNGESCGLQTSLSPAETTYFYQLPYEKGILTAIAYDEDGLVIARAEESSFDDAAQIHLTPDREVLHADGEDILFLTIEMQDSKGHLVKNANNRVYITVSEGGVLLGLDNGNSADPDGYKQNHRQLFSGKLLAMIGGTSDSKRVTITVSSAGLPSASITLPVIPAISGSDLHRWMGVPASDISTMEKHGIPVRKIDLHMDRKELTPEYSQTTVTATLYPANATFSDLSWRITDDNGLDMPGAVLHFEDDTQKKAILAGLGDGSYRLRCMVNNGKADPELISSLEFTVSGMGQIHPDPYEYVGAPLYSASHGEIGNGNERGIATSRTEMCWVAYEDLDFGKAGSDTFVMDVFEMSSLPTPIRFWKGLPYAEGSIRMAEIIYDKPSIWNVYQPMTFRLPEVLKGTQTFAMELNCKVHIKGFQFQKRSRGFDTLLATECDKIYGDHYQIVEDAITEIGNNVSLVYQELDFGKTGTDSITICGRSALPSNSIHLHFISEEGEERRIVEFPAASEYTEYTFTIDSVYHKQDLHLIFLPGSNFDLKFIRFKKGLSPCL